MEKAFKADFLEKKTGVIDLPEDDPGHVEIMLRFFYGETSWAQESSTSNEILRKLCKIHILADKFHAEDLKAFTAAEVQTCAQVIAKDEPNDLLQLLNYVTHELPDVPATSLRKALNNIAKQHIGVLGSLDEFDALLDHNAELAASIARKSINGNFFTRSAESDAAMAVTCNRRPCVGYRKTWTIENGPDWRCDVMRIWCASKDSTRPPDVYSPDYKLEQELLVLCSGKNCASKGMPWTIYNGPRDSGVRKPFCAFCGSSDAMRKVST